MEVVQEAVEVHESCAFRCSRPPQADGFDVAAFEQLPHFRSGQSRPRAKRGRLWQANEFGPKARWQLRVISTTDGLRRAAGVVGCSCHHAANLAIRRGGRFWRVLQRCWHRAPMRASRLCQLFCGLWPTSTERCPVRSPHCPQYAQALFCSGSKKL